MLTRIAKRHTNLCAHISWKFTYSNLGILLIILIRVALSIRDNVFSSGKITISRTGLFFVDLYMYRYRTSINADVNFSNHNNK